MPLHETLIPLTDSSYSPPTPSYICCMHASSKALVMASRLYSYSSSSSSSSPSSSPFVSTMWNGERMKLNATDTVFAALAVATSLLLVLLIGYKKKRRAAPKLPPGPPGWPLVGNLLQVAFSGKHFVHMIPDIRKRYGPIFTLRMGVRTLIVVTSPELAHEALIEKGQLFASRPPETPSRAIFSCDKFTVNSAVYGPRWRCLRRNMVSGMLSAPRLRDLRAVRAAAMDLFIGRLRAEAAASGGAVRVIQNVRFAAFHILLTMTFGLRFDDDAIVRIDEMMKVVLVNVVPHIDHYLPFLRPLFAKQHKELHDIRRQQIETILPLINRRRDILRNPELEPDAAPFSYLDSLLELRVDDRDAPPTDAELVSLCSEFINGGTDTTSTSVEWGMAHLIDNPKIQSKLHEEIVKVTGGDRPVDDLDVERMPYLQAFVKEVLRLHPPTYFLLTHTAIEPGAKLGGYDVPQDANLEFYLPTIGRDTSLWKNPAEFDPERFITGGEAADVTGSAGIRMIPFGAGRRICPGLAMGTTHISMMLARMVQAFEWRLHPSQAPKLDFTDNFEFTVVLKQRLLAVVEPRSTNQ